MSAKGRMKTDKFDCDRLAVEEVCAYEQAKLARPCRKVLGTGNIPSKTTPKEPSPIFFPTRKWVPMMPAEEPPIEEVMCPEDDAITWGVAMFKDWKEEGRGSGGI